MGTSLFGSARSGAVAASVMIWMVIASGAVFAQDEQKNDGLAEAKITGSQTAKVVQTAPAVQPEAAAQAPASPAPMVEAGNVTVNFKGADIKTVLAYISEVAGVDIVPAPDVSGTVDLKLTNKPWRTALDIIVRNYGFAYEREGDIIRVVTISKLKQEELTTQAFNLNYSKAKDVVASIKDIVGERGKVTYDDRTNTVIVTDIPTNIYKIGEIVSRLDKRTEQVLIEARILETILGDDEKLGIDWNLKITATGAQRPTTVPFNFLGKGNEYLNQFLPLSQVATSTAQGAGAGSTAVLVPPADFPANSNGEKSFPFAIKDNFTFGTLDFTEFQAVLEFLKERSNTDIISNPRIATLNNSPALINVGQTLNMPTYERNSTTGKMEVTGYEAKDLGILLQVTPHVNDNGEITIDLAPIISDLLRYDTLDRAAGIVAPVFSVRQAKTQVMIKDTQTIFIGGLIKENDIEIDNKVPFIGDLLGDIPYLGLLVNHKTTRKQKSELIFFITVNLMNSDKDIKNIPKASEAYVPIYTATTAPDPNPKKKLKTKQSL
jgi:type IV pilus assembly protein PilQ